MLSAGILSMGLISWFGLQTPHTLLWKISGKGIKKASYLFGTMHVLCADDAVLSDNLQAAIAHRAFPDSGKGCGRHAGLNFGDGMAYAVTSHASAPLLFKGDDFLHTDLSSAWRP